MSDSDCDCCNPDDPCASQNCTFFRDEFSGTVVSRITSRPNGSTQPTTFTSGGSTTNTRGNDPPSWEVDTELSASSGQFGDLFAINMITDSWNPSSQGAITALRFCIDEYVSTESYFSLSGGSSPVPTVECWCIVKQGGKTYGCKVGELNVLGVWRKQYLDGFTGSDLDEIYSGERPSGADATNPMSHPDFSVTGGAITFGWAARPTGPTSRTDDTSSETFSFWDNLCIHITHDSVVVDPGSQCKPTACDRFASKLSEFTTVTVVSALAGSSGGDAAASTLADSVDGRNPPCVNVSTTPPGSAPNPKSTAFSFLLHKDAVSPGGMCGIANVSVCIDLKYKTHSTGTADASVMLACRQGGKLYVNSGAVSTPPSTWSGGPRSATQDAFNELYASGSATGTSYYNTNSHPDFTSGGGDIEFGVVVAVVAKTTPDEVLIDNLCVKAIRQDCSGGCSSGSLYCYSDIEIALDGNLMTSPGATDCAWARQRINDIMGSVVVSLNSDGIWRYQTSEASPNGKSLWVNILFNGCTASAFTNSLVVQVIWDSNFVNTGFADLAVQWMRFGAKPDCGQSFSIAHLRTDYSSPLESCLVGFLASPIPGIEITPL